MNIEIQKFSWMFVFHRCCIHSRGINRLLRGKWSFYLPALEIKLPYSRQGFVECRSKKSPNRDLLLHDALNDYDFTPYHADDWKLAYKTPCIRRAVENYVITDRLYRAGLGPKPLGFTYVKHCYIFGIRKKSANYGFRVENVNNLPPRKEASEGDLLRAGVRPDKTKSCLRQQINGYLLDLNSVSGVQAIDAQKEINELLEWLQEATQV